MTVIDFETRSRILLKKANSYKYARHPSTEVLCLAHGFPPSLWVPGQPFPFSDHSSNVYYAFNAEFEYNIWNSVCVGRHGWPTLDPEQLVCIMVQAYFLGLPRGGLDDVCKSLGLGHLGKDKDGNKIMTELTKPYRGRIQKEYEWYRGSVHGCIVEGGAFKDDPYKHRRNEIYCQNDVVAEQIVNRITRPLPDVERKNWLVHREVNERGVPIDVNLCRNATWMCEMEKAALCERLQNLTKVEGMKSPDCLDKIKGWMEDEHGVRMRCMDEEIVKFHLKQKSLPKPVLKCLRIRMLYRDKAITKYASMLNNEVDGRCQGAHIHYKAGPGRSAGVGVNFLNLRRLDEDALDDNIALADEISAATDETRGSIYDRLSAEKPGVIPRLASMIRLAVCARPGNKLVVCDYSAIEMRMLHWLAEDEYNLRLIRDYDEGIGEEPYKIAAARIFKIPVEEVNKWQRGIGKVQILGSGYMAGGEKLAAFAAGYGIDLDIQEATELTTDYRLSNPMVKRFWYRVGRAATTAVDQNKHTRVGHVSFFMRGNTFIIELPSGRELKYYDPCLTEGPFGPEVAALDQRSGQRKAVSLPILVENIDQGTSRDLLTDALSKCSRYSLPVVLHVYDEIVLEVPEDDNRSESILKGFMTTPPAWADGLPVAVGSGSHRRYIK